jgi:hypothetical protein
MHLTQGLVSDKSALTLRIHAGHGANLCRHLLGSHNWTRVQIRYAGMSREQPNLNFMHDFETLMRVGIAILRHYPVHYETAKQRVVLKGRKRRAEGTADVMSCSSLLSPCAGLPRRRAAPEKLTKSPPLLTTFQEQKIPNNRRPQPPQLRRQTSRHMLLPLASSVRIALAETNLLKCGGVQA